jgi:hypothetical protein
MCPVFTGLIDCVLKFLDVTPICLMMEDMTDKKANAILVIEDDHDQLALWVASHASAAGPTPLRYFGKPTTMNTILDCLKEWVSPTV